MKKAEVVLEKVYSVKVSGRIQPVLITGKSRFGGWDGININTGKPIRIKTAAKLQGVFEAVDSSSRTRKHRNTKTEAEQEADAILEKYANQNNGRQTGGERKRKKGKWTFTTIKELGEVPKGMNSKWRFSIIESENREPFLSIREWVESPTYTGPTTKGCMLGWDAVNIMHEEGMIRAAIEIMDNLAYKTSHKKEKDKKEA